MPPIPPELMQLIQGGGGTSGPKPMPGIAGAGAGGGAGPGAGMAGGGMGPGMGAAPGGAPMSTPQPAAGDRQDGMVIISLAGDLLEQALGKVGHETEDGQVVLDVLGKLSKHFGHTKAKSQELVPAELMQLFQSLPQAAGMGPEAKAMGQQPMSPPMGMAA